eukprot:GGOE01057210.1.p1 GENE.GGOE01057210.1~~GGOE01057210.1.p1  ORF type:complete len:359 (+),score=86.78 GGOE01057210.1:86-1078(+)
MSTFKEGEGMDDLSNDEEDVEGKKAKVISPKLAGKCSKPTSKRANDDEECEKEEESEEEGSEEGSADEELKGKPDKDAKVVSKAGAAKHGGKAPKPAAKGVKSSTSKDAKPPPTKVTDVDKWILEFLNTRNRPYSSINVVDSSAGAIKKAAAEKSLAALHAAGKITCKDLKKQKVYVARQDDFDVPDASEVARMETSIKALTEEVAALERETKTLGSTLQQLQTQMSDEELSQDVQSKTKAIAEMEGKLQALRQGSVLVDETRKAKAQEQYEQYRGAWRKRKRMARDIIDAVCGDAKRPKDLMEELGIETDEQMQVTLEGTELPLKKSKA